MVWLCSRNIHRDDLLCSFHAFLSSFLSIGFQTICFAIYDLCLYSQYVDPLRRELEGPEFAIFEKTAQGLPLLDSFIKESMRLTPIESSKQALFQRISGVLSHSIHFKVSTRRQALQPFTFLDGTSLNTGDWVCTPSGAMARRSEDQPEPLKFHGFRFVDTRLLRDYDAAHHSQKGLQTRSPSKFTDTGGNWQVWGTGRMTWYIFSSCLHLILFLPLFRLCLHTCDTDKALGQPRKILRLCGY